LTIITQKLFAPKQEEFYSLGTI